MMHPDMKTKWQWDGHDNYFTRNFDPYNKPVGPALTAQEMEDLRRQGGTILIRVLFDGNIEENGTMASSPSAEHLRSDAPTGEKYLVIQSFVELHDDWMEAIVLLYHDSPSINGGGSHPVRPNTSVFTPKSG